MGRDSQSELGSVPLQQQGLEGKGTGWGGSKGSPSSWLGSNLQSGSMARERRAAGESKWGAAQAHLPAGGCPTVVGGPFEGCLEVQG